MPSAETFEAAKHRARANHDAAFDDWLRKPEIKALLSVLPPCENDTQKDVLRAVLRSAFEKGCDAGANTVGEAFLEALLEKERPRR